MSEVSTQHHSYEHKTKGSGILIRPSMGSIYLTSSNYRAALTPIMFKKFVLPFLFYWETYSHSCQMKFQSLWRLGTWLKKNIKEIIPLFFFFLSFIENKIKLGGLYCNSSAKILQRLWLITLSGSPIFTISKLTSHIHDSYVLVWIWDTCVDHNTSTEPNVSDLLEKTCTAK
jgi:hypothetical protein